ncbi:bifunctional 4-hydroxy-2-oxoglutarate aldolase/2-dehydro-3-deoxy-phosphogluconate aldolase [Kordiimonas gwangyangensis]|uniref:bifunctional 4-hydroxy-2-oxoglutarate aldolase/2-dehydro-3-deoxy-phosphogluconate aldolase n=1 Tax=Kordiimonas gwangyangensis TaxID=288022 RepID=UPI0003664919|nr:bifunctional 4-hydroxy-2-oxoglutarate aldolase/2-dehydro-3-deoxy-phosphogluconate aldolase [Kordiimonas gwangyangensis]
MSDVLAVLKKSPVIPVLAFKSAQEAVDVCRVLFDEGLSVLEITLRHESALAAINAVKEDLPADACVGAGTVVTPALAEAAIEAGAEFGVSPGLTPELAAAVKKLNWPFLPGIATLSEAMQAREWGFTELKFFPANISGGTGFLKAVGSVLPDLTFCPTGGISVDTAPDYRALPNVATVGGSWITPRGRDGSIDLGLVRELARTAVEGH